MPSFGNFANKLRETFDEGAIQFRVVEVQILWYLYGLDRKTFSGKATYKELEEIFNLTNGSVSRTLNRLGDTHRKGYRGFGLVEIKKDPEEGRRFLVTLSKLCITLIKDSDKP
tara:strand:- start:7 stop:345 length:339 start_codon:yes stop_codon:yes gene_type:complete